MKTALMVAYIDPGSGTMILQWVMAIILGTGVFFRVAIVNGFLMIFGKRKKSEDTPVDEKIAKDEDVSGDEESGKQE